MAEWYGFSPVGSSSFPKGATSAVLLIPGVRIRLGVIRAPDNAAWLVERKLNELLVPFTVSAPKALRSGSFDPTKLEGLRAEGFKRIYKHQLAGNDFAWPKSGAHFWWAPGAGKTFGAILWALTTPGRVIVVTKAGARKSIADQIRRFTTHNVFVIAGERATGYYGPKTRALLEKRFHLLSGTGPLPEPGLYRGDRGEAVEALHGAMLLTRSLTEPLKRPDRYTHALREAVARFQADNGLPSGEVPQDARFLVIGWETLPAHVELLRGLDATSIVWDEIHKAKSHKRWDAIPLKATDETTKRDVDFKLKDNVAAAAYRISRAVKRRLALTGTPIKDRPRDLWAQLDLVDPDAWGTYWEYAKRYCDLVRNDFGGLDDKGKSNVEELNARLSFVINNIPYSVTHADLPPKRRNVVYVDEDQQTAGGGFERDFKAAMKAGQKLSMVEIKLQEAASRKRGVVLSDIKDFMAAGQKAVIFTGRHRDCERLYTDIARAVGKGVTGWMAHGGHGVGLRDQIREEYMAHKGPCFLVGTGEAWGESIDLQDTDHALIVQLPLTPGQLIQWEGRFCRHGQTRPCIIHYYICVNSIDEHHVGLLMEKLPAVEEIVGDDQVNGAARSLGGLDDPEKILDSSLAKILAADVDDED